MTDEEIEKWLNDTYRNMSHGYQTSLEYGGKADPDFEEQIDRLGVEIDYINRLKKERNNAIEIANAEIKISDNIRKKTAKEILQAIAECQTVSNVRGKRYNRYELDQKDFENIADRYGVEVDDD